MTEYVVMLTHRNCENLFSILFKAISEQDLGVKLPNPTPNNMLICNWKKLNEYLLEVKKWIPIGRKCL